MNPLKTPGSLIKKRFKALKILLLASKKKKIIYLAVLGLSRGMQGHRLWLANS